jgi:hypothetical protein
MKNRLIKFYKKIAYKADRSNFAGSKAYWEDRYNNGGNSGSGSYGQLALFKAEIINSFIKENQVESFIEFGCGDGNQLKYLSLSNYIGFDVSGEAISKCKNKYKNDLTKQFRKVEMYEGETAECSLSLDVIFHLIEDNIYNEYMQCLFNSAEKFVVIYSSNKEEQSASPHVRHRFFTKWIEKFALDWNLKEYFPNKYPFNGDEENTSFCDFYIYEKTH